MKKNIFSICSIALVCCAIIMSCTKDDNSALHVGYASQPGYGGGNNPNPNGLPYVPPVTTNTTTTTPPPTTYGSITTSASAAASFTTSPACSSAVWSSSAGGNTLTLTFSAPPSSGTYSIVTSSPISGQVTLNYGINTAQSGTVTVSGSTATFTGAVFPSFSVTAGSLICH